MKSNMYALILVLVLALSSVRAAAQLAADAVPPELQDVGIVQKLGATIDTSLVFRDETGRDIKLSQAMGGDLPVVLTLNYYMCTSLCNLQLNGLLDTLREMKWTAGKEFRIVTVSFDPLEKPELAAQKRDAYLLEYARKEAFTGWRFLTGSKDSIQALCRSVGFGYRWNEETQQWAHDAALIVLSPDGRISRYLGGVLYDPEVLRLSLIEAGEGKVGSIWDKIFLTCFHYDPKIGRYTPMAMRLMQFGGGGTALILGTAILLMRRGERRRLRQSALGTSVTGPGLAAAGPGAGVQPH